MAIRLIYATVLLTAAFAQDPRGFVTGRVSDPSGAGVPGAEICVTNPASGVTFTSRSNESGLFQVPFLPPAIYAVSVEAAGFRKYVRDRVQVRVSETVDLDVPLTIGDVAEAVEVTGETPLLDTAGASLGQVVDARRVLELPLLAGNPMELTLLTPGVVNTTDMRLRKPGWTDSQSQISADGAGLKRNEFQIDGVSNNFSEGNGLTRIAFNPPAAAIREFKMQTTAYDASVGHAMGALINVSTASGTNELHGETHYWARNSAFDAANFFNNRNNQKAIPYQDHRYGASAGGPVVLPGIYRGQNRTFWFYAWEANKWGAPAAWTRTAPTAAQRQGVFSGLLSLGARYQIYDPATTTPAPNGRFSRQPFPDNVIPQTRLDRTGVNLASFYPLPNRTGTADGLNNFFYPDKGIDDYFVHLVRVDHAFSDAWRAFVRFHYDWWEEDKNHYYGRENIDGIVYNRTNIGLAADQVFVIGPRLVANVRYGATYQDFPERRRSRGYDLAAIGFSPALTNLLEKNLAPIPRVSLGSYSRLSSWEVGDGKTASLTHSLTAAFTALRGGHSLKFGGDFRVYRGFGNRIQFAVAPDLVFPPTYTLGPLDNSTAAPIGQELASMLLGIPGGSMERNASFALQDKYIALYLHDDYRLTRRLTLNLGLRYELELPLTERFDRLVSGFAFGQANPIEAQARANYARSPIPELPVDSFRVLGGLTFVPAGGAGRSPFRGERNDLLPRFGFSYQLTKLATLRGGFGIFYDTVGVHGTAPVQTGFSQSTPIQASLDNGLTFIATTSNPFPNGLLAPLGPAGGLRTNLGQAISFFPARRTRPYAQRWSLGVQRLLPLQFLLEATYVANRGARIGIVRQLNSTPARYLSAKTVRDQDAINFLTAQFPSPFSGITPVYSARISRGDLLKPYPAFGNVSVEDPVGYNWYHSLQVRGERRMAQGFTFQLSYTWSKLMEATSFLNPTDPMPYEVVGAHDRTHHLVMSGIWEFPFGRGKRFGGNWPAALDFALGGWQLGGIQNHQSGGPLEFGNIIFNGDLKKVPLPRGPGSADRWFNVDAGFNRDSREQLQNNIRYLPPRFSGIRGDGQARWDFSLIKNFRLGERATLQFRAEVYNAWNHTNFGNPNMSPTSTGFGSISYTVSQVSSDARNWQFSLRVKW